ncbi:MAG: hypothetical protein AAF360_10005 [Pseudomonadota bacterium]
MTDEVDVLRTITIWREDRVTPDEAYAALGERIPDYDLTWADVQAMALAKARTLRSAEIIPIRRVA